MSLWIFESVTISILTFPVGHYNPGKWMEFPIVQIVCGKLYDGQCLEQGVANTNKPLDFVVGFNFLGKCSNGIHQYIVPLKDIDSQDDQGTQKDQIEGKVNKDGGIDFFEDQIFSLLVHGD